MKIGSYARACFCFNFTEVLYKKIRINYVNENT